MDMPVTIKIADETANGALLEEMFSYFTSIDTRFSRFKKDSEVSRINRGEIIEFDYSPEMRDILTIALQTKIETHGYFDILKPDGTFDPSGIVKGWAIYNVAKMLVEKGCRNFTIASYGRSLQKDII